MPEGCATSIRGFHATEKSGAIFHAHSTPSRSVRALCVPAGVRCAPGRARDVRGPCAAPPIAGHAPCARAVSGNAQFMRAACADAIGAACELTITRLTCENSASERILGGLRCPYRDAARSAYPPCQGGSSKSDYYYFIAAATAEGSQLRCRFPICCVAVRCPARVGAGQIGAPLRLGKENDTKLGQGAGDTERDELGPPQVSAWCRRRGSWEPTCKLPR